MKNKEVLKMLYEIKGSDDKDSSLDKYIQSITEEIVMDNAKDLGMGSAVKTVKKILKSNNKTHPELIALLKSSKRSTYILTDAIIAVKFKADFGLPTTAKKKEFADKILGMMKEASATNKLAMPMPNRDELVAIVENYKAMPKDTRGKYPLYRLGPKLPTYNAEKLLDLMTIIPSGIIYVNSMKGISSSIYVKFDTLEGLLMPIR